jgi:DNA invertase Pin-like site-specific DNA recombinase
LFIWFAGRLGWWRWAAAKLGNRSQQLSAVPQRDANLLKIRIRQIAEYVDINIVVDKGRRVSLQANLRQPFRNLPHRRPRADLPALPATGEPQLTSFDHEVVATCPLSGMSEGVRNAPNGFGRRPAKSLGRIVQKEDLRPVSFDHLVGGGQACIYIRQSTPGQVRFNQESKERQYNLANQAKALGSMPEQIRILDGDLGHSGEQATHRDDFKTLVSDVAMGQVGAIFSLEASRLARSNKDWHRLLELCSITKTLVFDGDRCYDPADVNDSLVLGMKGTFAQADLHILRARLHGAKLNKAQKGELRISLPVGFVYEDDKIVLDPDQEVHAPRF